MNRGPNAPVVVGRAVRAASRIDRARVSARAGVIAAIPVVVMLALGTAIGRPGAAVTMAVGALLVGVAWRAGGPEAPPTGTMAAAASALTLATIAGTLSGRWPWVHHVVLIVVCLVAGSLTALGRRGTVVGTQSVIAFVVFGRFPQPLGPALALAGLILAGAAVQTGFAAAVALPPAWRLQRQATADAFKLLAGLARRPASPSLAAASALDQAGLRLSAPAILGDPRLLILSQLVDVGRRIRLELIALAGAVQPIDHGGGTRSPVVTEALARVAGVLESVAATLDGQDSTVLGRHAAEFDAWRATRQRPGLGPGGLR